ncbi:MAG: UDP-N-acetylglucosamine 1-carboxyvinyltransferase [Clostridia bacterium]|nr:UDP-N-acetylglucosamine 1-carboxyvinyltransferase [Clostridia bacterium]
MDSLIVNSRRPLVGETVVQGSKNSSLPILAATVLVGGVCQIHNCPHLTDTDAAISILRHLGCKVKKGINTVTVDSSAVSCFNIPDSLMREMRSSIVFLGSVLGRMGKAELSAPGGCEIGLRPIDLHLNALKIMGFRIEEDYGYIRCEKVKENCSSVISLSFPSVGATENIILAAALSKGRTIIHNAAREPEIYDLVAFLNECGCKISFRMQGTVVIEGVRKLHGCRYTVMSDRIVALTYMTGAAITGGDVTLHGINTNHFRTVIPVFESAGCYVEDRKSQLRIRADRGLRAVRDIRTLPYPGFPTDAQAPVMAMLTVAQGTSVIIENIFESRFKHVSELVRMGAKIKIEGKVALIDGVKELYGTSVTASDLRGGAALVVAGLFAKGSTVIGNVAHIDRGYEKIEDSFKCLGADIKRIKQ